MKTLDELISYLTERFAPSAYHSYEVSPGVALHHMTVHGTRFYLLVVRYGTTTYGVADGYASSYIRSQGYPCDEEFYSLLASKIEAMMNAESNSRFAAV